MAVPTMLKRFALGIIAGLQMSGTRDLYSVFGYNGNPEFKDFLAKYVRQDIAKRIVTAYPASTWKGTPEITGNTQSFDNAWKDFVNAFQPFNHLERADKLAGIGSYGILLIGFDDGASLDKPVRRASSILYMQPYMEGSVGIKKLVSDTRSPRFGKPEAYVIKTFDPNKFGASSPGATVAMAGATREIEVHWTRILHLAEDTTEDTIFGIPRLLPVYNLLDDLLKVCGGSAETFWLVGNRGLHIDVDKEMELNASDAEDLAEELEEYQNQLRRTIRTRGVKIHNLGSETPDPKNTFNVILSLLSGATGIPQRILLGAEAGQLASEQDRANWAERVEERQQDYADPHVLRQFIELMVNAGLIAKPKKLEIKWPSAFQLSPLEKAQMYAQHARSVINLSRQFAQQPITTIPEARVMIGLPAEGAPPAVDQALLRKDASVAEEAKADAAASDEEDEAQDDPKDTRRSAPPSGDSGQEAA